MCLTGLTPWVSSCAVGMKGDGYTTNSAYATTSPNAVCRPVGQLLLSQ